MIQVKELQVKCVKGRDYLAIATGEYALEIKVFQPIAVVGNEWG